MSDLVLFTSNCFGEDRSAALIASSLNRIFRQEGKTGVDAVGASLISEGKDYVSQGVPLLHSALVPPSGGFPTKSVSGFFQDLFSGSFSSHRRFIKSIRDRKHDIRLAVIVGDVFLLYLTRKALGKDVPCVFLSLPKSDRIAPHMGIELAYIQHATKIFLTRDAFTAENLTSTGRKAQFLGNPIMDDLTPLGETLPVLDKPLIGLLPGSREEGIGNFGLMLRAVEQIESTTDCAFAAAVPSTLPLERLRKNGESEGWQYIGTSPYPTLNKEECQIILANGAFNEIIHRSTVVLGLAGTANEQAAGIGKPVVAFTGSGPQTTRTRFLEQERLLGGAMRFAGNTPADAAREILSLLGNPEERNRRGSLGKLCMGESGGSDRIAKFLFDHFLKVRH